MVFKSARQRKFVMAKFRALSYKDGTSLGTFRNINEVFEKFPSERKAFNTVKKFNKNNNKKFTTTSQIKRFKSRNSPRNRTGSFSAKRQANLITTLIGASIALSILRARKRK